MSTALTILATWEKQPGERQDYDIDFGEWLRRLDDAPAASNPVAVSAQPGINLIAHSLVGSVVKVWLDGGDANKRYKVTATMTTAGGRIKEAEIMIHVKEV